MVTGYLPSSTELRVCFVALESDLGEEFANLVPKKAMIKVSPDVLAL